MPQWVYNLYWLFSARVPVPQMLMGQALVTIALYGVLIRNPALLGDSGLAAVALALTGGYLFKALRNSPALLSAAPGADRPATALLVVTLWLGFFAFLLYAPSLIWLQRGLSLAILGFALTFAGLIWSARDRLHLVPWFAQHWQKGQINAARWHVTRLLAMVVINEAMIGRTSEAEWLAGFALAPIALHYLFWWTVIATHPYEEDGTSP